MLDLISKNAWKEFYGAALAVRMTQGYANSLTVTTLYSIVSQNYKENKAVYIGYMEAACGVGLVLGPTIGSAIFSFAKYQWTFYIFGILIFLNVISLQFYQIFKIC